MASWSPQILVEISTWLAADARLLSAVCKAWHVAISSSERALRALYAAVFEPESFPEVAAAAAAARIGEAQSIGLARHATDGRWLQFDLVRQRCTTWALAPTRIQEDFPLLAIAGTRLFVSRPTDGGLVHAYDLLTGVEQCQWRAHDTVVTCCSVSQRRESPVLVTTCKAAVIVWDVSLSSAQEACPTRLCCWTREQTRRFMGFGVPREPCAVSAFGRRLAVASRSTVALYDLDARRRLSKFKMNVTGLVLRSERDLFVQCRYHETVDYVRLTAEGCLQDTLYVLRYPHAYAQSFAQHLGVAAPTTVVFATEDGLWMSQQLHSRRSHLLSCPFVSGAGPHATFRFWETVHVLRRHQFVVCTGRQLVSGILLASPASKASQSTSTLLGMRAHDSAFRFMAASWRFLVVTRDNGQVHAFDFSAL